MELKCERENKLQRKQKNPPTIGYRIRRSLRLVNEKERK